MRFHSILAALVFTALLATAAWSRSPDDPASGASRSEGVTGTVRRVTLYRGQALVTRRVPVEGAAGSLELVVSELPATIIDTSLYAESNEQLEVRAVRFRQRAVGEEPREEVRKLDQEIEAVQAELALNQKKTELAGQRLAYLDQLQGFVAPTASAELTSGVLNAETLKELTKDVQDIREKLARLEGQQPSSPPKPKTAAKKPETAPAPGPVTPASGTKE